MTKVSDFFKDRWLALLIAFLLILGFMLYFYVEARERSYLTKEFSGLNAFCSNHEKHGRQYPSLRTREFGTLSTIKRVDGCVEHSGKTADTKVYFDPKSQAIYGLEISGKTVLDANNSAETAQGSLWALYFCICLIAVATYLDSKKKQLRK